MKKYFNKIKSVLTTFWVILASFSSKVMWQLDETIDGWHIQNQSYDPYVQGIYWVPQPESKIDIAIKIFPRLLVAITFIVWIISFIKIRKIDDKALKKKKTKGTIYIMTILVILIIIVFRLSDWLLRWCTTCWRGL